MDDKELLKLYIPCSCDSEVMQLRMINDTIDSELQIAIYEWGVKDKKTSFKEKLRMIKKIITTGTFYSDQMIIHKNKMVELRDFLNKCIEENNAR